MLIQMKKLVGTQLFGRLRGKTDYAKICHELAAARPGEIVLLDFTGVSLIAGSWVNTMLVPLYRRVAEDQIDLFLVLTNIDENCVDDLVLVADWNHQCYLHLKDAGNKPDKADLIGSLDSVQAETLKVVLEYCEVTGAQLEELRSQDKVKATAWNNRLKDLYKKRLLRRRRQGREQFYSPVVKEIVYG